MYEIVGRGVDLSTLWQGGHCSVLSPLDARVGECDLCPIVRYPLASLGCRRYRCRTGATRDPSPPCWYIILLVACLAPANLGKKDPNVATANASSVCRRVGFLVVVEHSTRTTPGTLVHTHTHTRRRRVTSPTSRPSSILVCLCAPFDNLYTHEYILHHHSPWSHDKELQAQPHNTGRWWQDRPILVSFG